MQAGHHGVLVVDKPAGMTSADVVARVKRLLKAKRVGHTGTLDPMATGVLPIVLGEGTKLAPFLLADDKEYEGELELGIETDTLDIEGTVLARRDPCGVTREALQAAVMAQTGELQQIPPMVSALKHEGKRLYELARAGVEVERAPRPVRVDRFELLSVALPRARFRVACSKGTYVRALVRDVGAALGTGATLTALRRTRSGPFALDVSVTLADLEGAARPRIVGLAAALAHLPSLVLPPADEAAARNGKPMAAPPGAPDGTPVSLLSASGDLIAVVEIQAGRIAYLRGFGGGAAGPTSS